MKPRAALLALLATLAVSAAADTTVPLRPFDDTSFARIKQAHTGRATVVALWSLDCVYCLRNLDVLARAQSAHPHLHVVTVATDPPEAGAELLPILARAGLRSEAWAFADAPPERLRHAIDPQWRGEMPRSYLIDGRGGVTARSGLLSPDELERLR